MPNAMTNFFLLITFQKPLTEKSSASKFSVSLTEFSIRGLVAPQKIATNKKGKKDSISIMIFLLNIIKIMLKGVQRSIQHMSFHSYGGENEGAVVPQRLRIKKAEPTNYIDGNTWYISPLEFQSQLKKQIAVCENLLESFEQKKSANRQEYEKLLTQFKKAQLFLALEQNQYLSLYIYLNLASIYNELQLLRYTSITLDRCLTTLSQICLEYSYSNLIPKNYFGNNFKFINTIESRFFYHILRGRVFLALCMSKSKDNYHEEAFNFAKSAYSTFIESAYQLMVFYFHKMMKFLQKHNYLMKNKVFEKPSPITVVEYKNFKLCINTLYSICKSQINDLSSKETNKIIPLIKIVEEQIQTIKNYTYYDFNDVSDDQFEAIDLEIKKKIFTDFVNMPLFKYEDFQNIKICVEIGEVHRLAGWIICSYYCISAESQYISNKVQLFDHEVSESEHWLSKSLELCNQNLPDTALYHQIKKLYKNLHNVNNLTIKEDEQYEPKKNVGNLVKKNLFKNDKGKMEISTLKSKELDPIVIRKMKPHQHELFRIKMLKSLENSNERKKRKNNTMMKSLNYKTINETRKAYQTSSYTPEKHSMILQEENEERKEKKIQKLPYYTMYRFKFQSQKNNGRYLID